MITCTYSYDNRYVRNLALQDRLVGYILDELAIGSGGPGQVQRLNEMALDVSDQHMT